MCGRFTLISDIDMLEDQFDAISSIDEYRSRYNIAPSQQVLSVINDGKQNKLGFLRWGLIPSWAKDPAIGNKMINARSETLSQKPSFKNLFKNRRCLVLADSFYEWKKEEGKTTPMRIRLKNHKPFAMAGLWDKWTSPEGKEIFSCSVITTNPNELMALIHDRMPVILNKKDEGLWLDRSIQDTHLLGSLLVPYELKLMEAYEVSSLVNSPKNEVQECIKSIL